MGQLRQRLCTIAGEDRYGDCKQRAMPEKIEPADDTQLVAVGNGSDGEEGEESLANQASTDSAGGGDANAELGDDDAGLATLAEVAAQRPQSCVKCGVTQSPKWRINGTLCNACGLKRERLREKNCLKYSKRSSSSCVSQPALLKPDIPLGHTCATPYSSATDSRILTHPYANQLADVRSKPLPGNFSSVNFHYRASAPFEHFMGDVMDRASTVNVPGYFPEQSAPFTTFPRNAMVDQGEAPARSALLLDQAQQQMLMLEQAHVRVNHQVPVHSLSQEHGHLPLQAHAQAPCGPSGGQYMATELMQRAGYAIQPQAVPTQMPLQRTGMWQEALHNTQRPGLWQEVKQELRQELRQELLHELAQEEMRTQQMRMASGQMINQQLTVQPGHYVSQQLSWP